MTSADNRWEYLEGAIKAAKRMGITNDQVREAVLSPHSTSVPAKYGKIKKISDKVTVVIDPEDRVILHVNRTKQRDKHRKDESHSVKKISGGSKNKKHYSIDELVDLAVDQGFRLRYGSKHKVLYPPNRDLKPIGVPVSSSDWRAVKNLRAQLIRSGLEVDNES